MVACFIHLSPRCCAPRLSLNTQGLPKVLSLLFARTQVALLAHRRAAHSQQSALTITLQNRTSFADSSTPGVSIRLTFRSSSAGTCNPLNVSKNWFPNSAKPRNGRSGLEARMRPEMVLSSEPCISTVNLSVVGWGPVQRWSWPSK